MTYRTGAGAMSCLLVQSACRPVLCLALAIYAFSVFGYVVAALASVLVERGRSPEPAPPHDLHKEIARLADALRRRQ